MNSCLQKKNKIKMFEKEKNYSTTNTLAKQNIDTASQIWCLICKKTYKTIASLKGPRRKIHGSQKYKCQICDKMYTNVSYLKRHIDESHGDRDRFKCPTCHKMYTSKDRLNQHCTSKYNRGVRKNVLFVAKKFFSTYKDTLIEFTIRNQ